MKSLITLFSINLILISCTPSPDDNTADSLIELDIDKLVQTHLDSGRIAGLAVGAVRNDSTLLMKSYGFADLEFDVPLPIDASFEIGSITKQFTAVAIMQLVGDGKLNLEDPFTDYIDFDTQGKTVTIYQLLNHTSGIKGYTEMAEFGDIVTLDLPRDSLLRIVEKVPFDFEPGEAMIYNNTAYFILGLLIEKVSGQTYEEYLKENIFDPAGLNNTYYCDERAVRKRRAHGYDMNSEGQLERAGYLDHLWPYAAGSLCSTVEDLLRWLHVLHNSEDVLPRELYQQLTAPSTLNDGTQLRYAMGLGVSEYKGNRMIGHGGGIFGFLSDSRYFPNEELAIVTLINTAGPVGPSSISRSIADQLLNISEREPAPFEGDLDQFSGTYTGPSRGGQLSIVIDGSGEILLSTRGNNTDTLNYLEGNTWFLGNTLYKFADNETGVKELQLDQGGGYYILLKED